MKRIFLNLAMLLLICFSASAQNRPLLAVLDFETESFSKSEMVAITSLITSDIFQSGKYDIIDAEQRNLILDEIEFSYSDCADERCQIEVGKMLSADLIVVGNISRLGSWLILSCKILEVKTTQTVAIANGRYRNIDQFIENVSGLTSQLLQIPIESTDYVAEDTTDDKIDDTYVETTDDFYTDDSSSDPFSDDFNEDFYSTKEDNYYTDSSTYEDTYDDSYSDDTYSDDTYYNDSTSDDTNYNNTYTDDYYSTYDDQRSGIALEGQFGFAYNTMHMGLYGTVGLTYQFDDTFSLGGYFTLASEEINNILGFEMPFLGGMKLILGNKVDEVAIGLNIGFPMSISLYLQNTIFSLSILPTEDPIYSADFGISLFIDDEEL